MLIILTVTMPAWLYTYVKTYKLCALDGVIYYSFIIP